MNHAADDPIAEAWADGIFLPGMRRPETDQDKARIAAVHERRRPKPAFMPATGPAPRPILTPKYASPASAPTCAAAAPTGGRSEFLIVNIDNRRGAGMLRALQFTLGPIGGGRMLDQAWYERATATAETRAYRMPVDPRACRALRKLGVCHSDDDAISIGVEMIDARQFRLRGPDLEHPPREPSAVSPDFVAALAGAIGNVDTLSFSLRRR